jgi:hypothetical protein
MHCTENFHLEPKGRGVAVYVCTFFFNILSLIVLVYVLQGQTPRVNFAEIAMS